VSSFVKRLLIEYAQEAAEFEQRRRIQAEVLSQIADFRAVDRLKRDGIHDREGSLTRKQADRVLPEDPYQGQS
jgi:hypothetical protein